MNAVPFDTLKMARKLEVAGMTGSMAAGTAEAIAEAVSGADLATKAELKSEISGLRTEMTAGFQNIRNEIELLRRDITIKVGGMMVVAVGVILTAMRYLPPHP